MTGVNKCKQSVNKKLPLFTPYFTIYQHFKAKSVNCLH